MEAHVHNPSTCGLKSTRLTLGNGQMSLRSLTQYLWGLSEESRRQRVCSSLPGAGHRLSLAATLDGQLSTTKAHRPRITQLLSSPRMTDTP